MLVFVDRVIQECAVASMILPVRIHTTCARLSCAAARRGSNPDALAQGQLGLVESLQCDEAASMCVMQRRRRSRAGQRPDARCARLPQADRLHSTRWPGYGLQCGCRRQVRRDDGSSPPLRFRGPEPRRPPRAAPTGHRPACRCWTRMSQSRVPRPAGRRPGNGEPTELPRLEG